MKKLIYILVPVLALSLASCNKTEDTPTPDPTPTTPTTPTPPSPSQEGANAALIAIRMTYSTTQAGFPVDLNTEIGVAAVYQNPYSASGTNTMIDAGVIKVNNNTLDKATNNSYSKTATVGQTPSDLGFTSAASWTVAGGNGFPALTHNVARLDPDYTGTVPATITRTSDLTFTFNSTTTTNADSVYVVLITGSTNKIWHYKANAGTVTIPASELSAFSATTTTNVGYIEICPWNYENTTDMGKTTVYIRERAIVKSVTVN